MENSILRSEVVTSDFFEKVGYGSVWEDECVISKGLSPKPGERVLSITSGGDFSLQLLLYGCKVTSLDFNPRQNYLLELKVAALKYLTHDELWCFMGLADSADRIEMYWSLRNELQVKTKNYWDNNQKLLKKGVIFSGKQDRFFQLAGKLTTLMQGRKTVSDLFQCKDLETQRKLVRERWENWRWNLLTKVIFSEWMMHRSFHKDHFTHGVDNQEVSHELRKKGMSCLLNVPIATNFYLYWAHYGTYPDKENCPAWLRKSNFNKLREQLYQLTIQEGELENFIFSKADNSFDAYNFSNIFDWVTKQQFVSLMGEVVRCANDGARFCYWNNLMIKERKVSYASEKYHQIEHLQALSTSISQASRTPGYSGCTVARINKD